MKTINSIVIFLVMTFSITTGYSQQEVTANTEKQTSVPAYIMAYVRVHNQDVYQKEYLVKATPIIMRHGGEPVAVSESPIALEGELPKGKLVIVKFPSMKHAKAFYNDPEYQPLKKAREKVSSSDAVLFERGF